MFEFISTVAHSFVLLVPLTILNRKLNKSLKRYASSLHNVAGKGLLQVNNRHVTQQCHVDRWGESAFKALSHAVERLKRSAPFQEEVCLVFCVYSSNESPLHYHQENRRLKWSSSPKIAACASGALVSLSSLPVACYPPCQTLPHKDILKNKLCR